MTREEYDRSYIVVPEEEEEGSAVGSADGTNTEDVSGTGNVAGRGSCDHAVHTSVAAAKSVVCSCLLSSHPHLLTVLQAGNIFNSLPGLPRLRFGADEDKLDRYLASAPEPTKDTLTWWTERRAMYPTLSRMALDYLLIPGKLSHLHWALFATLTCPVSQQRPSMSNGRSAEDGASSPMSVVA